MYSSDKLVGVLITPGEYYRLRKLSRVVAWFRTSGLDLAITDEGAIAEFVRRFREGSSSATETRRAETDSMSHRVRAFAATYLPLIAGLTATLLLLIWASPVLAAETVPSGAQKALAGANTDSEHRAQKRITNEITGPVWMVLAGVIVSTITAIAVAYGLIEKPF